jgi:hypothetical protein
MAASPWSGPVTRKVLHALDADFYIVYKAPKPGSVTLPVKAIADEVPDAHSWIFRIAV